MAKNSKLPSPWDEHSCWPREGVMRWWEQGWDWECLKNRACPHPDYKTYAEYFEKTKTEITFPDPRIDVNPPLISETEYWRDRWLTRFPPNSERFWDPYHLPTIEPLYGIRSPKHTSYEHHDRWSDADREALLFGLRARAKMGEPTSRNDWTAILRKGSRLAPLAGVVVPGKSDIRTPGKAIYVDFSSALFGEECRFSSLGINEDDQEPVVFGDNTTFESSLVGPNADFTGATFKGTARFTSAHFGNWVIFSDTHFERVADFENAAFSSVADFSGATFGVSGIFRSTTFRSVAGFNSTLFGEMAIFTNAVFEGFVAFRESAILGSADFSWATKDGHSDDTLPQNSRNGSEIPEIMLRDAHILGDADFSNRAFLSLTDFSGTHFLGCPSFHGASLHENTVLTSGTYFSTPPGFEQYRNADRDKSQLEEAERALAEATAELHDIRGRLLEHARSVGATPPEVEAEKSEAEESAEKAFRTVHRLRLQISYIELAQQRQREKLRRYLDLKASSSRSDNETWSEYCQSYEQAYRRLKLLMQQQGARNEEQFFYTKEIQSRMLRLDVPRTERAFAWLYRLTSNYGQSILRPFLWALIGWPLIVSLLLLLLTAVLHSGLAASDALHHCANFVLRNVIPGTSLREGLQGCTFESCYQLRYQEWIDGFMSAWWGIRYLFYTITTLYSAVSVALWFLFALALRRRFQVG